MKKSSTQKTTKTVRVVFSIAGFENSTSRPIPHKIWTDGCVDLESTGVFCLSSDDDRLVVAKLFSLRDVELPSWLDPEEWLRDCIKYKYLWASGVSMEWPETWQRSLMAFSPVQRWAVSTLLRTKNFRSGFRKSLRDQLVSWMETEPTSRKYSNPFSSKQWSCLLDERTKRDGRISERLSFDDTNYVRRVAA